MHDFATSLKRSLAHAEAPWWREVYKAAFAGYVGDVSVRDDCQAQRLGIDRVVFLSSGKSLYVDEKVREGVYEDILLESWSDIDRRVPGWIRKDLQCDYIAYAFAPVGVCYLLPFLQLRRVWDLRGAEWTENANSRRCGFRTVIAQNRRYRTGSIAVPIGALMGAMSEAMLVTWQQ